MLYYKDIPIFSTACIAGIHAEHHLSGLPATQAGREVYMPLIQQPEAAAYTGWLSSRAMVKIFRYNNRKA